MSWKIYDDLLGVIPTDIRVRAVEQGPKWTRVLTDQPSCGIALSMNDDFHHLPDISWRGLPLVELAQQAKNWNFALASVGMAAVNSYYSHPDIAAQHGFLRTQHPAHWGDMFVPYSGVSADKNVAIIGHFPFAPQHFMRSRKFCMLERNLQNGDLPDSAAEYILPEADYVFISGSAWVNKTMPRLLELSQEAHNVIVGPSTTLAPSLLTKYRVTTVTGLVAQAPEKLFAALGGIHCPGMFEHAYRVEAHCG